MARRSRFLVVLLVLVGLHACASAQSVMNSWLGHHQSDLIRSWGPPSSVASDGAGGTILIYIVAPSPAVTAPAQIALNDQDDQRQPGHHQGWSQERGQGCPAPQSTVDRRAVCQGQSRLQVGHISSQVSNQQQLHRLGRLQIDPQFLGRDD